MRGRGIDTPRLQQIFWRQFWPTFVGFFFSFVQKSNLCPGSFYHSIFFCKAEIGNQDLHTFNQFRLCIFRISYWCWYLGLGVLVIQGRRSLFKIEGLRHLKWANYICPWKRFSVFFQVSFGNVSLYALLYMQPLLRTILTITPLSAQISGSNFHNSGQIPWCLEKSWCLTQTLTQNLTQTPQKNSKAHVSAAWCLL